MGAMASGSNGWKPPSAAADKAGTRRHHGARQGKGEKYGCRRENMGAEPSGVGGNNGGREASGVDPESHGGGEGAGGRKASGVAENPGGGGRRGVGRGVTLPQGAVTPGVATGPRGDKTPGSPTAAQDRRGEDGRGEGMKTHPPPE